MADDFATLPNLGPKSNAALRAAGIESVEQLRALGAVGAYLAVKRIASEIGFAPSLNLLWALEGALSQRSWQAVARDDRLSLLMQLEQAEQERQP
ncbi:MAG TPA: TfoX/Sxy family protein [Rhodocyclaceae bacterium]